MVVPVEENNTRLVNLSEIKKFVGNNLQLRFPENTCTIIVVGNNCFLKVASNFGVIKVIGNNCVVQLQKCDGSVEYVGNNGNISVDSDVKLDALTYKGTNGKVKTKNWSAARNENSKSKDCLHTSPKKLNQAQNSSLENLDNLIRTHIADRAIFVNNNVKILNPHIKIKTIDLNSVLCRGIVAT